jgi:tetratricopeptide (TPR) repeat protein
VETDERIILWDREGEPVDSETITSDRAFVTTTIAPDGNSIAVAVADYSDCPENKNVDNCVSVTTTIELWDVEENKLKQAQTVECENCKEIRAIALSKDGQFIASGSNDNIVRLWKRSGDLVHKFPKEHTLPIESIAFSHDGKWIASGSQDNKVMLWNTEKVRDEPLTLSGHRGWVSAIAFSSDDEFIATGSWDKTVRLWDIDGNPMGSPFKGHTQWISSVRFSSDDKSIISGSAYDSVRRWQAGNLKDWQKEACLQLRDHPVFEQRSFSFEQRSFSFEQRSFSLEDVKRLLSSLVGTFNSLRLRSLCNKISSSSSSEQTTILPTPTATSSNPSIVQPPVQNVPSPTSRSNNRQDKPSFPAPANAPTRPQNFPSPTPPSNNGQNSDEQAASDRRRARALNPTAVNAHINQALTYHRQGNYQQAISNYSKAIALNPNSAKAYSNRAAAYIEQRDYQRAIADSTKALNLISTYINAYINRGLAYYYQGDYEKAIADYTSALELDPYNYNAFHNRSLAYQRLAEVKEQRN